MWTLAVEFFLRDTDVIDFLWCVAQTREEGTSKLCRFSLYKGMDFFLKAKSTSLMSLVCFEKPLQAGGF